MVFLECQKTFCQKMDCQNFFCQNIEYQKIECQKIECQKMVYQKIKCQNFLVLEMKRKCILSSKICIILESMIYNIAVLDCFARVRVMLTVSENLPSARFIWGFFCKGGRSTVFLRVVSVVRSYFQKASDSD